MEDMKQDLERLIELKESGIKINERDYDDVARRHNTTRDEVIACLCSIEIDNIDMSQDCSCEKCGGIISLEEASAFNGVCQACDNKED